MPLHWVYDVNKMKEIVGDKQAEFFVEAGHNTFYKVPAGSNSFYGDQTMVLLESLAACKGKHKCL